IEKQIPDIMVQEMVLPDMDGLELVRRVRHAPGAADLPIIAVSAVCADLREPGRAVGFNACLSRPIEPARLFEAIEANLGATISGPIEAKVPGRRIRVLVVDDKRIERRWIQLQLMQLGLDVAVAASGHEALAAAADRPPDIIVSDVL